MTYDAVIVGGGLGGSALADQLARAGHTVLVIERETQFKDRVRGENMLPWGVGAARRLGILDDLVAAGGNRAPIWQTYTMGKPDEPRDLLQTTPDSDPMLNMYHPHIQETLIARAAKAGADIRRGAVALGIDSGPRKSPSVTFEQDGIRHSVTGRIVVGADGRASQMRAWGGFEVKRNPELLTIAGTVIEGTSVPTDCAVLAMGPGCASFWAPFGNQRARTYFIYPGVAGKRGLSGAAKAREFLQLVEQVVPAEWLEGVSSIGPLAEFDGADKWIETPAKDGVVLIGDAAASTDPSWGCGLSLTLTDVEHLSNALGSTSRWDDAVARYAREHDEYYGALNRILSWMTELVWTPGPEADARRGRVFSHWRENPRAGYPDNVGLGPFGPNDERARRLVLGLD